MSSKLTKKSPVNEILVVSLSNIGDVVLTTPVIDTLLESFPKANVTVIVGSKAKTLFEGQPRITTLIYEKRRPFDYYRRWYLELSKKRFDVIVDLRQTFLSLMLASRWHTPIMPTRSNEHMVQKHMLHLKSVFPLAVRSESARAIIPKTISLPFDDYIVIAPGAADVFKRWPIANYKDLLEALTRQGENIIVVGDDSDNVLVNENLGSLSKNIVSLAGKTDLCELCYVLLKSKLMIGHDSGIMHLANYVKAAQIILWGPTDMHKYKPWNSKHVIVYKGPDMSLITLKDVVDAIEQLR